MEDILASIRRILNEDEAGAANADGAAAHTGEAQPGTAGGAEPVADEDEILVLDQSMIVVPESSPAALPVRPEEVVLATPVPAAGPAPVARPAPEPVPASPAVPAEAPRASDLLAPESEAAAVSSVGSLLRLLTNERSAQVHRGGPTIEDLVREEIRPLLKGWLDAHLPPLVERLVRVEIERVTGRAAQ